MASCSNKNRNPATTSTDQNANITIEECMCPICMSILIEPVSLPCKHILCMPCFRANIEETSMCCPMCRVRIATWSRQASRKNTLVDEKRWNLIKSLFPEHVQRRLNGEDDLDDDDLRGSSRASSCPRLAEPGEIRKEYEEELKKVAEEEIERKRAEFEASEALVRKLQEEELRKANKWQEKKEEIEQTDEEIARRLQEALRQEISSPPGIRATRQRAPTLLDKFMNRSERPASCNVEPTPQLMSSKPVQRSNSASLFFPCSKSKLKVKSESTPGNGRVSTSKSGNSRNIVVDSQVPSTSSVYHEHLKRDLRGRATCTSVSSGEYISSCPDVTDYLQGVTCEDQGVPNVGESKSYPSHAKHSGKSSALGKSNEVMQGMDLQKTCVSLAEHIFNKSCSGLSGDDFQVMYPNLSSPNSERSSSMFSPLIIDEKVRGLDSAIPDVMLSSCANTSEVSALRSSSVKEVIVLSSDSEMSPENSVVSPFISIPVINISDSSANNTPVPSTSNLGASGDAKILRSLSVAVERLPTPSLNLMHQNPEDEPSTSSSGFKQSRCTSVESTDSISTELNHFKPIQICPRTPPKRLPNGKAVNPPIVLSTPRNLNKKLCLSPSFPMLPQASTEASPLVKRRLQDLAKERLHHVKVRSKGIATDKELVVHPTSPFKPMSGLYSIAEGSKFAQATKKLDFSGGGDIIEFGKRRNVAKIANFMEQNRVETFTLPEDYHDSMSRKLKADAEFEPVVQVKNSQTQKSENACEDVKKSPGRVYNMRRTRKRVKNSQESRKDIIGPKNPDMLGTPSTIRTIEDWIRSSQEKQKNDVRDMISVKSNSTCAPPLKRLCTRSVVDDDNEVSLGNFGKVTRITRSVRDDPVISIGTSGRLKKSKKSNNQMRLDFAREQRRLSECDSDGSSISERVSHNHRAREKVSENKKKLRNRKKRKYSEVDPASDENCCEKSTDSGTDMAGENEALQERDRRLALELQKQFNVEAKSQVTLYRLRGGKEEYLFRPRASSASIVNSKAS